MRRYDENRRDRRSQKWPHDQTRSHDCGLIVQQYRGKAAEGRGINEFYKKFPATTLTEKKDLSEQAPAAL